ncbi:MAG: sigma-54 dependent transcriptional regulator [Devosiaceae bacterium]|nr:sigma-54 dependent transcriptional regulator [Devosiaceae bacterium]
MTKVLIVDDDPVQLRITSAIAQKDGMEVLIATGGEEALSLLREHRNISAMVLDMVMPDLDGMGVMQAMAHEHITCPTIVQTASSSLDTVINAMRQGAVDFFVKPVAPERLIISLRNALKLGQLETCVRLDQHRREGKMLISDIIAQSPAMDRVIELATKAAKSDIPVLIEGETGVGKEVIARAIQGSSNRAGKPFIIVNCGAIPKDLIESTLFGHKKGSFTGATNDHAGKFLEADGGTLFLDEIGELPKNAQVKLLRALQSGEIEAVGASKPKKVNVRIISATNRRLLNMAKEKTFREDLYYRMNVFPIYVPPLRDRPEDIDLLAQFFLARLGSQTGRRISSINEEALQLLQSYNWPGNVRQLENAIYRAIVLCDSNRLAPVDFPQIVIGTSSRKKAIKQSQQLPNLQEPVHIDMVPKKPDFDEQASENSTKNNKKSDRFLSADGAIQPLNNVERDLIAFALQYHDGKMSRVAKSLKIGRSTLYRKLKEYELDPDPDNSDNPTNQKNNKLAA